MDIQAIIFDKDGTLLDFDAFWIAVSVYAIKDMLKQLGRENIPVDEFLDVLGCITAEQRLTEFYARVHMNKWDLQYTRF